MPVGICKLGLVRLFLESLGPNAARIPSLVNREISYVNSGLNASHVCANMEATKAEPRLVRFQFLPLVAVGDASPTYSSRCHSALPI